MRTGISILCVGVLLAACSGSKRRAGDAAQPAQPGPESDGGAYTIGSGAGMNGSAGPGSTGTGTGSGGLCTSAGECEEYIPITTAAHETGKIDYRDKPPAGGKHNPCWGTWSVYDTPLPAENWVHNLEHGGVVLLFDCPAGCSAEVDEMSAFVAAHPRTLLTEYADMDARFAVLSWGYRLLMDDLDLATVEEFYLRHFDQAPESFDTTPASCPALD